jgi:hypothetical protein
MMGSPFGGPPPAKRDREGGSQTARKWLMESRLDCIGVPTLLRREIVRVSDLPESFLANPSHAPQKELLSKHC